MYYHGVECHAQKLVHYLQCQGHDGGGGGGAYIVKNMTISTLSSKLLVSFSACNPNWFDSIAS